MLINIDSSVCYYVFSFFAMIIVPFMYYCYRLCSRYMNYRLNEATLNNCVRLCKENEHIIKSAGNSVYNFMSQMESHWFQCYCMNVFSDFMKTLSCSLPQISSIFRSSQSSCPMCPLQSSNGVCPLIMSELSKYFLCRRMELPCRRMELPCRRVPCRRVPCEFRGWETPCSPCDGSNFLYRESEFPCRKSHFRCRNSENHCRRSNFSCRNSKKDRKSEYRCGDIGEIKISCEKTELPPCQEPNREPCAEFCGEPCGELCEELEPSCMESNRETCSPCRESPSPCKEMFFDPSRRVLSCEKECPSQNSNSKEVDLSNIYKLLSVATNVATKNTNLANLGNLMEGIFKNKNTSTNLTELFETVLKNKISSNETEKKNVPETIPECEQSSRRCEQSPRSEQSSRNEQSPRREQSPVRM